ncbi:hypothetical protein D9613_005488 [Agrocybe pediades]|uniref:G-patch domain-containing protein n=1 Tax=Agrocybe pediades TaxID=84607 RepID=A0A8H4VTR4_9AGAR|nr:hypothetical protein D9613_005488 [Agrocybe pediades]
MADDDDDYLSDKFLAELESSSKSKPKTYSEIRKEALKKAQQKNEQNRTKSRRQREIEAREEGLSKSLFERAKEEEAAGISSGNKALSIMMKMGFKPGQSLGNVGSQDQSEDRPSNTESASPPTKADDDQRAHASPSAEPTDEQQDSVPVSHAKHKVEPLPLQEWAGKKGIGLGSKRARSPTATERLAKMAKMADDMSHRDFRDRARDEYKNRKAEGQLIPAQRTCTTLDEQMGIPFNILWLNPSNHDTFPSGLIDALTAYSSSALVMPEQHGESIQDRLRRQMQADALHAISPDEDHPGQQSSEKEKEKTVSGVDQYPPEILEEAAQFLRLQVS